MKARRFSRLVLLDLCESIYISILKCGGSLRRAGGSSHICVEQHYLRYFYMYLKLLDMRLLGDSEGGFGDGSMWG